MYSKFEKYYEIRKNTFNLSSSNEEHNKKKEELLNNLITIINNNNIYIKKIDDILLDNKFVLASLIDSLTDKTIINIEELRILIQNFYKQYDDKIKKDKLKNKKESIIFDIEVES